MILKEGPGGAGEGGCSCVLGLVRSSPTLREKHCLENSVQSGGFNGRKKFFLCGGGAFTPGSTGGFLCGFRLTIAA